MKDMQLLHSIDYSKYRQHKLGDSPPPPPSAVINFDEEFVSDLQAGLSKRGLVIIDNIDLDEEAYLNLTQLIGRPLNLPHQLVPSKLPGFPEIARVGNFDAATGEMFPAKDAAFGEYWHHDGDFWPEGEHHIVNLLHSKIVPSIGGHTGFISTIAAYDLLEERIKLELANANVVVDPSNIEDFRGIAPDDWETENIGAGGPVVHPILVQDKEGDTRSSVYLPFFDGKVTLRSGRKIGYDELFRNLFDKDEVKYLHAWKKNQLLVWDNLKVMHRAMGGSHGKRLLWRTQGRLRQCGRGNLL